MRFPSPQKGGRKTTHHHHRFARRPAIALDGASNEKAVGMCAALAFRNLGTVSASSAGKGKFALSVSDRTSDRARRVFCDLRHVGDFHCGHHPCNPPPLTRAAVRAQLSPRHPAAPCCSPRCNAQHFNRCALNRTASSPGSHEATRPACAASPAPATNAATITKRKLAKWRCSAMPPPRAPHALRLLKVVVARLRDARAALPP